MPRRDTFVASFDALCNVRNWTLQCVVSLRERRCGESGVEKDVQFLGKSNWLTTMLCVSISYAVSSCTRRSVSYRDKNSDMQTQTNVVFSCKAVPDDVSDQRRHAREDTRTGSLNWVLTSLITARIDSSFANMSSCESCCPPIMDDICRIIGPNWPLSVLSLPSAFSSTVGKERNRNV